MNLVSKYFNELSTTELYEILKARAEIFVVAQKCAFQDLDNKDYSSLHIFYESDGKVLAYTRAYPKSVDPMVVHMGRVLSIQHGIGLGGKILKDSIHIIREQMHAKKIYIEAQCHAIGFYEREGFVICSDEFLDEGIPHVKMELTL